MRLQNFKTLPSLMQSPPSRNRSAARRHRLYFTFFFLHCFADAFLGKPRNRLHTNQGAGRSIAQSLKYLGPIEGSRPSLNLRSKYYSYFEGIV